MDQNLENEIILSIEKDIGKFESCSIKQVAQNLFYNDIKLSEQKKIAKLIVKKNHYITETKDGEIIVKKNLLYIESKNDTNERHKFLKFVMWIISAAAAYLVFKVFLPSL